MYKLHILEHTKTGIIVNENVNVKFEDLDDLLMYESEINERHNKLLLKYNLFLVDFKEFLYKITGMIKEVNKLVREGILIFSTEIKGLFNTNILKEYFNLESFVQELYQKSTNSANITYISLKDVFYKDKDIKAMNDCFKRYQKALLTTGSDSYKELVKADNIFDITKYDNIELFFENVISINPKAFISERNHFIIKSWEIMRDPGFFYSWRNCSLIITKQNHILIIDDASPKKYSTLFELGKFSVAGRPGKKNQFLFEFTVTKKGNIMNASGRYLYDAKNQNTFNEIMNFFLVDN